MENALKKIPFQNLSKLFENCLVFCNGCGKPMRYIGEWPVKLPEQTTCDDRQATIATAVCWQCTTCRIPSDASPWARKNGVSIFATLVPSPDLLKHLPFEE